MTTAGLAENRRDNAGTEVLEPKITLAEAATLDEWLRDWKHYKQDTPPRTGQPVDLVREAMAWLILTGRIRVNEDAG